MPSSSSCSLQVVSASSSNKEPVLDLDLIAPTLLSLLRFVTSLAFPAEAAFFFLFPISLSLLTSESVLWLLGDEESELLLLLLDEEEEDESESLLSLLDEEEEDESESLLSLFDEEEEDELESLLSLLDEEEEDESESLLDEKVKDEWEADLPSQRRCFCSFCADSAFCLLLDVATFP
jgi:hypothetical protein